MVLESSSPRVSGIFHSHHNPIASSLGCKIFKDEFVITLHITNVYRRARPDSVYENTKIWGFMIVVLICIPSTIPFSV